MSIRTAKSPVNPLPAHAGGKVRPGNWLAERCVYNWKASNTRKIMSAMGMGGYFAPNRGGLLVISDSISQAQVGATSFNHQHAWPSVAYQALTAGGNMSHPGAGGMLPGGTNIFFGSSGINGFDERCAKTGTWTNSLNGYITGADTATITFPNPAYTALGYSAHGTAVDVAYEVVTGSAFTVTIDGGAPVAVPMTGSGYRHYTVSGLTDGPHSVVITVTGTTAPRIIGLSVYRATGFMIHNWARSGSTAEEWAANATGTLHPHRLNGLTPGATGNIFGFILSLGANDMALNNRTAAEIKGYLQTIRGIYAPLDVVLMNYPEGQSPHANFAAYNEMLYDLADEWDCPLIDNLARTGGWAVANANGIMSADGAHPNTRYHAALGKTVASLLAA